MRPASRSTSHGATRTSAVGSPRATPRKLVTMPRIFSVCSRTICAGLLRAIVFAFRREHFGARGDDAERRRNFVRDARRERAHRRELVRAREAIFISFLSSEEHFTFLDAERDAAEAAHEKRREEHAEQEPLLRAQLAIAYAQRSRDDHHGSPVVRARDASDRHAHRKTDRAGLGSRQRDGARAAFGRARERLALDARSVRAPKNAVDAAFDHHGAPGFFDFPRHAGRRHRVRERDLLAREIRDGRCALATRVEVERDADDRERGDHRNEQKGAVAHGGPLQA